LTRRTIVRGTTILGGILGALLLLEIILQAGSLFVWWEYRRHGAAGPDVGEAPGARAVLCVGDSYTFGSGSSSPQMAYPRQLEKLLREASRESADWRVVNAGWPGRNSTELLQSLPGLLARSHPRYVCILVGLNNRWSRIEPESAAPWDGQDPDGGERFVWRWRTARLLRIAVDAIRTREQPKSVDSVSSGNAVSPVAATRSLYGPAPLPELVRVRELLAFPDSAGSARSLALAARSRVRELGDAARAALLAHLLFRLGLRREAVEEAEHALRTQGETPELCQAIISPLARLGRTEEALHYAHRAVLLAPNDPESHRGLALASRLAGNTTETVRALARGYALDGDDEYLERQLRRRQFSQLLTAEQVDVLLQDLPLERSRREAFLALYRRSREAVDLTIRLEADLLAACELVRRAGAIPLLLTYPLSGVALSAVETLTGVAQMEDVPLVRMMPAFARALATHDPEALFVPDGHCTDLGYYLMAREVATTILELEDATP
jgi:lysophospholipase L1-like esterase